MRDYSEHSEVIQYLKNDQEACKDLRESIAEIIAFQHHPQGQWEPDIWAQYEGRPRYTFDQVNPQVEKAWAEMAANEYSANTQPCGGGATEDVSNIYDGLLRDIYSVSSFDDITTKAGKRMISTGFSAWRAISGYVGESFHQSLQIIPIHNAHERVWFDSASESQTNDDADHVFVLQALVDKECEKKWKDRDGDFTSVSSDLSSNTYSHKSSHIVVGEVLYKKPYKKTLYLLDDEDNSVVDEEALLRLGIIPTDPIIVDSRECDSYKVYSRKFDGKDWLEDEKETVFNMLPVIGEYAHFDVVENKVTYRGLVKPLMDAARVFNYTESRKVEEAVLAPRKKIFMDDRLAEGRVTQFSRLNTNPNAVQLYKGGIKDAAMPFEVGGINPSPALSEISQDMIRNVELSSGLPNAISSMQNTVKDSDFRFEQRESMGSLGTFEYYRAHKVALEHTAKVLLNAIPRVYDTKRKIRIIGEDGQSSEITINETANINENKNNLTIGNYDVSVRVGSSFADRTAEANSKLIEMSSIIPGLADRNADILTNNIDAPGMRTVSDRERERLFESGVIPDSQLTDIEKEKLLQAQNQPPPPSWSC